MPMISEKIMGVPIPINVAQIMQKYSHPQIKETHSFRLFRLLEKHPLFIFLIKIGGKYLEKAY